MYPNLAVSPDMVGKRQPSAPIAWRQGAAQPAQQLAGVAVGHRQRGNLEDDRRSLPCQPFGVLGRADAGRQRIARVQRQVDDRPALHAIGRPRAALRVDVVGAIAIVHRVRIDQAAHSAMFLSQLGLQTTPAATVACDDDLALHADPSAGQRVVIVRHALIDVDQVGSDVAVSLVRQIRWQRVAGVARGVIPCNSPLLSSQPDPGGGQHFDRRGDRRRIENPEGLDPRVPPPGREQCQHHLRIGLVMRRADMVGLRGHRLEPGDLILAADLRIELRLQRGGAGFCRAEAASGNQGRQECEALQ